MTKWETIGLMGWSLAAFMFLSNAYDYVVIGASAWWVPAVFAFICAARVHFIVCRIEERRDGDTDGDPND